MIKRVTIIGAGKVGSALATRLKHAVVDVRVVRHNEFDEWCASNEPTGDVVVIAVRDTDVKHVAEALIRCWQVGVENNSMQTGRPASDSPTHDRFANTLVLHVNGSMRLDVLQACADAGARVGAAHPFQTFGDADESALDGIGWGIECADAEWPLMKEFVKLTAGVPYRLVLVDDEHKRVYHTAAIAASNYTYAAYEHARRLAQHAGIPLDVFLLPIMERTYRNAARAIEEDVAFPLTGPIQRGDVAAVTRQLASMPDAEKLVYIHLSLALLNINKTTMTVATFETMSSLLMNGLKL
ncbi:MAG: Rossmann-like and DUF2520 domain-containing protein [bacterium]|nr:Rossmann-like and DUF2520 domain-containing protein [bacterium]